MITVRKIFASFSKKERSLFWSAVVIACLALLGLILFFVFYGTRSVPANGGKYSEALVGQPTFINPILSNTEIDKSLVQLLFSPLGENISQIEPDKNLANWKVRLAEDLSWTDKTPITSEDIVFTLEMIKDPATQSPLRSLWQGVSVRRLGELEVEFTTNRPELSFKKQIESLFLIPTHIFKNVPAENWRISDYNLQPVSNGLYKFKSLERKNDGFVSSYNLEVNKFYRGEEPFIDEVSFALFADYTKAIEAFETGSVQAIAGVEPETLELIERPFNTYAYKLPSYYAVFFNQSRSAILRDKNIRMALALSTPKDLLIKEALFNEATILDGPIMVNTTSTGTAYNQNRAEELLDSSGWRLSQETNSTPTQFRKKMTSQGEENLEINLAVPKISFLTKSAEIIQKSWQEIGVKVNLILIEPDQILETIVRNRDYEALIFGNILNKPNDLSPFWHSNERFYPGLNLSLYNNKRADQLMEEVLSAPDPEDAQRKLNELVSIISNDVPAIFLYSPSYLVLTSKNIKGVEPSQIESPYQRLNQIRSWYMKTSRVFK